MHVRGRTTVDLQCRDRARRVFTDHADIASTGERGAGKRGPDVTLLFSAAVAVALFAAQIVWKAAVCRRFCWRRIS